MREFGWYSVAIDVPDGDGWGPFTAPWTQVWETLDAKRVAAEVAWHWWGFDLDDAPEGWRIRVFEGYNRWANQLAGMTAEQMPSPPEGDCG